MPPVNSCLVASDADEIGVSGGCDCNYRMGHQDACNVSSFVYGNSIYFINFYQEFDILYILNFDSDNATMFLLPVFFCQPEKKIQYLPHHSFALFHQEAGFSSPMLDFATKATTMPKKQTKINKTFIFSEYEASKIVFISMSDSLLI